MFIPICVLLASLAGTQAPRQSMYREVIPNPTGKNGYEEYLQAADAIGERTLADAYLNWSPTYYATLKAPRPEGDDAPKPTADQLALAERLSTMTLLDVRREAATRYSKVVAWLHQGSLKKVWQPRETISFDTKLPEFAYFGRVGKVAAASAYVAYADGKGREGTQILLDTLKMGQDIEGSLMIASLYSMLIESTAMVGLHRHFPAMSLSDAILVEKAAATMLAVPPKTLDAILSEAKMRVRIFGEMLDNPDRFFPKAEDVDPESAKWVKDIKALPPASRASLVATAQNVTNQRLEPTLSILKGPESGWVADAPQVQTDPQGLADDTNGIVAFWLRMTAPSYARVGVRLAVVRARLRLLGLYASVVRYKWEKGRLPSSLDEAVTADRISDPLSGEKFVYQQQGPWDFRIFSPGAKATGLVDLDYQELSPPDNISRETPP